jgi:hypothetical protein
VRDGVVGVERVADDPHPRPVHPYIDLIFR